MSVVQFSAAELGRILAAALRPRYYESHRDVSLELYERFAEGLAGFSEANTETWNTKYNRNDQPVSADEIMLVAVDYDPATPYPKRIDVSYAASEAGAMLYNTDPQVVSPETNEFLAVLFARVISHWPQKEV